MNRNGAVISKSFMADLHRRDNSTVRIKFKKRRWASAAPTKSEDGANAETQVASYYGPVLAGRFNDSAGYLLVLVAQDLF